MANPSQTGYNAPVQPFQYPADEASIWPCPDCWPWHVDVLLLGPDGGVWVREWHAVDCTIWER